MIFDFSSISTPCAQLKRVYHAAGESMMRVKQPGWLRLRWAGLAVLAVLLFGSTPAHAKKLVISEAFEITGKIQRPQAMYILQRQKLNLKGLQLRRSLIPKLLESMRKPPL
tara:strand:+ start:113 stop:445 length:333 start_codon:yes stop_codon:yes gene_type:complete